MVVVYTLLVILGSLGVFLFGMHMLSEGLQKAAGPRLKKVLGFMTTNRFAGVASGFATTAVIQSSSATTVMVVGFVDAALLTLRQAIGVIMGANIGTTVTGWIVALLGFKFSITGLALPAIAIGTTLAFVKQIKRKEIGELFLGFGLLFLGLGLLKDSVPDIRNNPEVLLFLSHLTDHGFASFLMFVIAGTTITIIVQSSSAAMAITLTMTFSGWIDYPTAAAIILGENIGTTVTAYLASLNAGVNARRAARAHTLFNVFGVVWIAFLFHPFLSVVDLIVPGEASGRLAITEHLAMFHTLFNIVNTTLFIGFIPLIERAVVLLVRERPSDNPTTYQFPHMSTGVNETPEFSIVAAQSEVAKMAEITADLFSYFRTLFHTPTKSVLARKEEFERTIAMAVDMHEQITSFLVESSREPMSEQLALHVNGLVRIVTELESIADTCNKLIRLANRKYEDRVELDTDLVEAIRPYEEQVAQFLVFNVQHLRSTLTEEDYEEASTMEDRIDRMRTDLKKAARKRIRGASNAKAELFYIDVLRYIEHIGDFSFSISEALRVIR